MKIATCANKSLLLGVLKMYFCSTMIGNTNRNIVTRFRISMKHSQAMYSSMSIDLVMQNRILKVSGIVVALTILIVVL